MSKSLKKLIDINRLREFKNKLVGTGSAYVQTAAVDQTVAGTKTFSEPIVGSVTGSSGSCTGNAATATNATYTNWLRTSSHSDHLFHTEWDGAGYFWTYVTAGNGDYRAVRVARSDSTANADHATSADSATNASHATSADTATKAEQDGNGNNIAASYVVAGTEDATTDIGSFMSARPSFIKSFVYNNVWTDAISMRHRNGSGDGPSWGTYIRSSNMTGVSNLLWNHQYGGNWQGERTLVDNANLAGFIKSAITIYDLVPDGAEAHNAMWGGRDITAAFNNGTFSANVANGTFRDIFPGDYITKSITIPPILTTDSPKTYTVNWVVADCDYWINKGDTAMTAHHVVIVPQTPIFDTWMNNTNTTEGGYAGSWMYRATIPRCATGIVNAFGSDHILTFRDHLSREVNTSAVPSGITASFIGAPTWEGEWVSVQCNLMSEKMVFGAPVCSGGAIDNIMATRQMSAFRLSEKLINYNRSVWWLRDVVSSASFANVLHAGNAHTSHASDVRGVRPFALLK